MPPDLLGGFLAKDRILALYEKQRGAGSALIDPLDPRLLTEWAYDMRLGESYLATSGKHTTGERELVTIEPGEFALLLSEEKLNLPPDHVGLITLKFSYALKGLVNVSGFHVDPLYSGKVLFSVYNAGPNPVTMRRGDPLFMLVFCPLVGDTTNVQPRRGYDSIRASDINQLHGPSESIVTLGHRVEKLEHRVEWLLGILGAVVVGAILALIRFA